MLVAINPSDRTLAEENLKVLDQQVHPLDVNSTPYNFSSTISPLLHKAAHALNLPTRSPHPYVSSSSSSSSSESPQRLDDKYTGQILVSSYHVSYILPKEFPRRELDARGKRPSKVAHFMAAIELWAPFVCQPPHAPYLVSSPIHVISISLFIIYVVVYSSAALPLQPHPSQDISTEYPEDLFVNGILVICG